MSNVLKIRLKSKDFNSDHILNDQPFHIRNAEMWIMSDMKNYKFWILKDIPSLIVGS